MNGHHWSPSDAGECWPGPHTFLACRHIPWPCTAACGWPHWWSVWTSCRKFHRPNGCLMSCWCRPGQCKETQSDSVRPFWSSHPPCLSLSSRWAGCCAGDPLVLKWASGCRWARHWAAELQAEHTGPVVLVLEWQGLGPPGRQSRLCPWDGRTFLILDKGHVFRLHCAADEWE